MQSAMSTAQSENYPPIPNTITYLGVFLGQPNMRPLCRTVDGEDYIFQGVTGTIQDNSVCLVFVSGRMLAFLQSCHHLHFHATVVEKPRRPRYSQIFHIMTKYDSVVCVSDSACIACNWFLLSLLLCCCACR